MKRDRFKSLGERLGNRMNTWWEKDLSFGGKEVHIKAIAQAIPTYIMSVFRLQEYVCETWVLRDLGLRIMGRVRPCQLKWVAQLMNDEGSEWNHRVIVPPT